MFNFPTTVQFRTSEVISNIEIVEQKRNCTFVGDFCIKNAAGVYGTDIVAVFWQETPPVEGYSNYFALLRRGDDVFITSGESAVQSPIAAIVTPMHEVVYSRSRWDYRQAKTSLFAIDGGRDYTRIVGNIPSNCRWAQLVIKGPTVHIEYHNTPADEPIDIDAEIEAVVNAELVNERTL